MRIASWTLAFILAAGSAGAQTVALVIGNENYENTRDVNRADELPDARRDLDRAGIQVVAREDANFDDIREAVAEFGQMVGQSERLIVALAGRFVSTPTDTYFLPVETDGPPLSRLPYEALPLSQVLAYLSNAPGEAVLLLGQYDQDASFGPIVKAGIGDLRLPDGVIAFVGEPRNIARFLRGPLIDGEPRYTTRAFGWELELIGEVDRDDVFLDKRPAPSRETDSERQLRDSLAWRRAEDVGTAEAYRGYIAANPDGLFRRMAEARIRALDESPEARAERIEQSLDLNRDARREIQRDLSLLDYNTRGIDGIFGRGTRSAITSWQRSNGYDATGYLTRDQITALDRQAQRRAEELEQEAERRRQRQLAEDRQYWDETGARGGEANFRAYLNRYPDGEFADLARLRLDEIEERKRGRAGVRDRRAWERARAVDTIAAYRTYLDEWPNGDFRDEARSRIDAIVAANENRNRTSEAEQEEQALNLSPATRQLIETRLASLGLEPGRVDGIFDQNTRRAIRRYQNSRGLPQTGYVSEALVVRLLADTVRQIFR